MLVVTEIADDFYFLLTSFTYLDDICCYFPGESLFTKFIQGEVSSLNLTPTSVGNLF